MKRAWIVLVPLTFLLASCSTSPTGEPQLSFFPQSQLNQMGAKTYQQKKEKVPRADNPAVVDYVQCVAHDITAVAPSSNKWQVTVFKKDVANAWALPGGYIGVYTGLLKYARDQAQLAAVLGHEVSHVLAHHANARLSTAYATQAGMQLTEALLNGSGHRNQLVLAALGVGAKLGVLLPYSRSQEAEADVLGLKLMAKAGFDPRESIKLWHNMSQAGGGAQPAFLSSHPANDARIEKLQDHMDAALKTWHQARNAGRHPSCQAPASGK